MKKAGTIYRGDSFAGTVTLNQSTGDGECGTRVVSPFPIPMGAVINMYFPGSSGSVILSSANSGEITITDPTLGAFTYSGSPAKSLLLLKGSGLAIDVVVVTTLPAQYTFEAASILNVKDRANP